MISGRFLVLAMAIGVASCTSAASPESGTTLDPEVDPATTEETAEDQSDQSDRSGQPDQEDQPNQEGLPDGYTLSSGGTVNQVVPPGSTALRTVVAVGPSPSDPRFVEYTLVEVGDGADVASVTELAGVTEGSDVVDLASGTFAFVPEDAKPRSDLQLLNHGPSVNAAFRALVEEGVVAVGGSANLQPAAIEELLTGLLVGEAPERQALPQKMSVLVDSLLPEGRFVELKSVHGTTSVVVYDGVGREWFDYFTWGDPELPPPAELADLAEDASLQPPTRYGTQGATDPERVSLWADDRLTIIEHPSTTPPDDVRAVAALVLDQSAFDGLFADAVQVEPDSEAESGRSDPDRPASDPPSQQDMAAFQQFVETRLGIEHGHPIVFDYVPEFPTEGIEFDFISSDLWLTATALGLTGDGTTLEEANQSRIDAIRGTPGVIAVQPTKTETDVVTVHEMVHVIAPQSVEVASAEPFSMSQVVSEGNAHRIAFDYLLTLDAEEQAIMDPFPHIFRHGSDPRISSAVQDLLEFPYDEGRVFMAAAAEDGGEARVAEVHQRPPTSTEQIVFFDAWLNDDQPTDVPAPDLPPGSTALGEGSLGVYLLLLVATDVDKEDEALVSLREWSGDSYILYEAGSETCLSAAIEFDSSQAASDLGAILRTGAETVEIESQTVLATFCS